MSSVRMIRDVLGLNKSLRLCGVSKTAWYHTAKPRDIKPDGAVLEAVRQVGHARPTYGTRRMAAQVSRDLGRSVNRKTVRRVFKKLDWTSPSRTKSEIIRSNRKVPRPDRPNTFWESDMTYIWCGTDGWCYCFNVIDVFTRQWRAFVLEPRATRHAAIMAVNNAAAAAGYAGSGLTLRVDNGTQYTSRDFRASAKALGITLEYIYVNTPEQNGHVESFHKTLKKEYIWPREFHSLDEARLVLQRAFEDYNNYRIHSALGYLTPEEFASQWREKESKKSDKGEINGGEKSA